MIVEGGLLLLVEAISFEGGLDFCIGFFWPSGGLAFEHGKGEAAVHGDELLSGRSFVALASVGPVATTVDEFSFPKHVEAHGVGAEGEVDAFGISDADAPWIGPGDEVAIDGGFSGGGNDGDGRSAASLFAAFRFGIGEGFHLHLGSFPSERDELLTLKFVVFDFNIGAAFFELNGFFGGGAGGPDAIACDDFFSVDAYGASVIGVVVEGVFAIARDIEPAFPDETVVVAFVVFESGMLEGDEAFFFFLGVYGF